MNEIEKQARTFTEGAQTLGRSPTLQELQDRAMEVKRSNDERYAQEKAKRDEREQLQSQYLEKLNKMRNDDEKRLSEFKSFARSANKIYKSNKLHNVPLEEIARNLKDGYEIVVTRDPAMKFIFDQNIADVIRKVATWMHTEETPDNRFKRGLLLRGQCGVGKTALMRAMQDVFAFYNNKDYSLIKTISSSDIMRLEIGNDEYSALSCKPILFIDDLGEEATDKKVYGNSVSPVIELIRYRYECRKTTIISTNKLEKYTIDANGEMHITGDELKDKYGDRIFSRLHEMCNWLTYDGEQKSFREL